MATAKQTSAGGGLFSKLVVVALLAVTVALYLRIVMVDETAPQANEPSVAQASVRVLEGDEPAAAAQPLEILPEEQMAVIMQVFAPELLDN